MIDGARVLITGGAGFIGSSLALRLVDTCDVVVLDNLHRNAIRDTGLLDHPRVTMVKGDVLDAAIVDEAARGCDVVVHMASIAGVDTVMRSPVTTMRVALLGTMNVLDAAARQGGIRRFVDFSTSEVFGRYAYKVTEGDHHELGAVGEARWTYAVSKLATEHLALSYHRQHAFPATSIRPFNIYGPRQVGEGAVHHFIVRALKGEDLIVHNDGSQIRSWCYIDDIVDGIMLVLRNEAAVGEAFNIGNPRSTLTIFNLAREIVRLAGSRSAIRSVTWDATDVELRIPDVGKARRLLGYEPKVDLEEGLARTIEWYRARLAAGG
ncbi:MAG: NAD-dependent epimerase/dehydratase family protein [Deltaproteobacteria bacterium]|nr:NAD-dependent epimerase/dehydratase family protein [Deltaproteobacteria bacterium]